MKFSMRFFYPKFLKIGPKFVGLSIFDLFILVFVLLIALLFNLSSFECLGLMGILIGISKIIALRFPRGYFQLYFHKRGFLDWREDILKLTSGVFI
jgi:hypothetical protein